MAGRRLRWVCVLPGDSVDSRALQASLPPTPRVAMAESCRLLTSRTEQGVLVLTVTESQIEGNEIARELQREMLSAVDAVGARLVVVDLQHVRYVSSVAFGPLLHLRRKLQASAGRLVVCGLSAMVGDVFYTTRMVSPDGTFVAPFEMQADAAAAVAALGAAPGRTPSDAPPAG